MVYVGAASKDPGAGLLMIGKSGEVGCCEDVNICSFGRVGNPPQPLGPLGLSLHPVLSLLKVL